MEFQDPDIAKFLSDPVFVRLVKKGEDKQWKEYEQANWEQREVMAAARLILLASERFPGQVLENGRKQVLWNRIEEDIEEREGRKEGRLYSWRMFASRYWWAAATLVLIAGSVLRTYRFGAVEGKEKPRTVAEQSRSEEIVNDRKSVFPVDLPDGSTVLLAPDSRVRYDLHDFGTNGQREIYLSGEAFFEVVPNKESPFYVYAGEFTTKVLGTSFNVRAFPGDAQAEVVVRTGRVTVFAAGISGRKGAEPEGEIVNPDERIVLDRNKMQLSLEKLEKPEIPDEQLLHFFDDRPVSDIFGMLEKSYGIEIRYPDDLLSDCRITASFVNETLYEKIRLICKGLGATYKVVDGEIVIDSEGCI